MTVPACVQVRARQNLNRKVRENERERQKLRECKRVKKKQRKRKREKASACMNTRIGERDANTTRNNRKRERDHVCM